MCFYLFSKDGSLLRKNVKDKTNTILRIIPNTAEKRRVRLMFGLYALCFSIALSSILITSEFLFSSI